MLTATTYPLSVCCGIYLSLSSNLTCETVRLWLLSLLRHSLLWISLLWLSLLLIALLRHSLLITLLWLSLLVSLLRHSLLVALLWHSLLVASVLLILHLLLLCHTVKCCSVSSARSIRHVHTCKCHHRTGTCIGCCSLHSLCLCTYKVSRCHIGTSEHSILL